MTRRLLLLAIVGAALLAALPAALRTFGLAPDPASLPTPGRPVPIDDGMTLHVLELGSGPPVVLVHGLPGNLGDWAGTPAALAALGHHVVAYDRVGYGLSSRADPAEPDAYTYGASARDLRGLLDALRIERATLVGWSYGGGVVQVFARENPERTEGIVLLGSVGPAMAEGELDPLERLARMPGGLALLGWALGIPPLARRVVTPPLAEAFSGAAAIPEGWVDRTLAELARPGTLTAWAAEQARHDTRVLRPEEITVPALVVHGSDDRLVPLAVGEDLARRLPRGRLVVVDDGSHMLPATHATRLASVVHEWMALRAQEEAAARGAPAGSSDGAAAEAGSEAAVPGHGPTR